jgi:hypothetical protein
MYFSLPHPLLTVGPAARLAFVFLNPRLWPLTIAESYPEFLELFSGKVGHCS